MYSFVRSLLFRLDAERAHGLTLNLLRVASGLPFGSQVLRSLFVINDPVLEVQAFGLHFKNRVGLAAGYDKNGVAIRGLSALGFGHLEIGTVTRLPQVGNSKPRVHRVQENHAVINSMGFPNAGVAALLKKLPPADNAHSTVLGINIGKGKDTLLESASEDYCALLQQVAPCAGYVAINISSPNTQNLRALQAKSAMLSLLRDVAQTRKALTRHVPILVKIAPDLSDTELDDVLDAIAQTEMDGVIATNTTLAREGLPSYAQLLKGGLSGSPLTDKSTKIISAICQRTGGKLPIVGVGGVMTPRDALAKIEAGATLVQIYTGMIYYGPRLVRDINQALR